MHADCIVVNSQCFPSVPDDIIAVPVTQRVAVDARALICAAHGAHVARETATSYGDIKTDSNNFYRFKLLLSFGQGLNFSSLKALLVF